MHYCYIIVFDPQLSIGCDKPASNLGLRGIKNQPYNDNYFLSAVL